jgi:hypothetical protein
MIRELKESFLPWLSRQLLPPRPTLSAPNGQRRGPVHTSPYKPSQPDLKHSARQGPL